MANLRSWIMSGVVAQLAWFTPTQTSLAQDIGKSTSLRLAPVDADLYIGSFRQSEQWKAMANSPVARKLMSLPVVEENLAHFKNQWKNREGGIAQVRMVMDNPNAKEAIQFLQQLAKDESFFFIDKSASSWVQAAAKVNEEIQSFAALQASGDDTKLGQIVDSWIDRIEGMKVPTFVMGAKCDDEDLAITKIDQLEAAIQLGSAMAPEASRFTKLLKRVDDDRGSRLTIELSGKLIPWDSIPTTDAFDEESQDNLREVLNEKSIAITIGTLDKYFVIGISDKSKEILALGKSAGLLEHADMAPVRAASDKPLVSISYVSDALAAANYASQMKDFFTKNFGNLSRQLEEQLELSEDIEDFLVEVREDLNWMDASIAKYIPPARGTTGYGYLTSTGWEQILHNRTKDFLLDGSKPLAGLQHIGGDPMLMVVTRFQDRPEYFQLMRQIVQRAKKHLDVAMTIDWGTDSDELAKAKPIVEMAWPLLVRFADAWEKKFLPAFEGEHGVILNAGNLAAKQWAKEMPPSDVPVPLPEVTSFSRVKDASLLKEGFQELYSIMDAMVEMIKKVDPNGIPASYTIPRPTKLTTTNGTKYGYPIPDDCPAPKSMMPHGLISGSYLFASYSEKQSEQLAKAMEPKVGKGVIDSKQPLANASYIHVGRIFGTAKPWLRYGLMQGIKDLDQSLIDTNQPELDGYTITANDIIAIWGALESIGELSSTTTVTGDGRTILRAVYSNQSLP